MKSKVIEKVDVLMGVYKPILHNVHSSDNQYHNVISNCLENDFLKRFTFFSSKYRNINFRNSKTNLPVTQNMHRYFMKYILINSSADI